MNVHLMVENFEETLKDVQHPDLSVSQLLCHCSALYRFLENDRRSESERGRGQNPLLCSKTSDSDYQATVKAVFYITVRSAELRHLQVFDNRLLGNIDRKLMLSCWSPSPNHRPSVRQLTHDIMHKHVWNRIRVNKGCKVKNENAYPANTGTTRTEEYNRYDTQNYTVYTTFVFAIRSEDCLRSQTDSVSLASEKGAKPMGGNDCSKPKRDISLSVNARVYNAARIQCLLNFTTTLTGHPDPPRRSYDSSNKEYVTQLAASCFSWYDFPGIAILLKKLLGTLRQPTTADKLTCQKQGTIPRPDERMNATFMWKHTYETIYRVHLMERLLFDLTFPAMMVPEAFQEIRLRDESTDQKLDKILSCDVFVDSTTQRSYGIAINEIPETDNPQILMHDL
ncbi:hypothetical protein CLF_111172 [Clonorchis sinensis]|uniref:Uncharacterized protein n=1 Tax=Clonorchis sinensis TaxID=79923 RepID=G7YLG6_CLOSI|nr:hypothetical protein CLF_111172 [Clonorchis sinensis]